MSNADGCLQQLHHIHILIQPVLKHTHMMTQRELQLHIRMTELELELERCNHRAQQLELNIRIPIQLVPLGKQEPLMARKTR